MASSVHKSQLRSNSPTTLSTQQLNLIACSCLSMLSESKLDGLCSICRFQTARRSSVFLFPLVCPALAMVDVSALTCVPLFFLLCRDSFHSLHPSITAHGSARRNLFIELVDRQEAQNRCIMQHVRIAMSKGVALKQ